MSDQINHPPLYGGESNPYEAIKVIEAWELNFLIGNTVKYLCRAGKKPGQDPLLDLEKALWYLQREIGRRKKLTSSSQGLKEGGQQEQSERPLEETETQSFPKPTSSELRSTSQERKNPSLAGLMLEVLERRLIRVEEVSK